MQPVDSGTGERLRLGGDEITVLATCAQTDGALFAVGLRMPPGGGPPSCTGTTRARSTTCSTASSRSTSVIRPDRCGGGSPRTGDVVPLVGGTPHTVRNESDAAAIAFVVHAPGAPMEGFCRAAAALAAEGHPSMAAVLTIAARHGVELLGPVPQPTA